MWLTWIWTQGEGIKEIGPDEGQILVNIPC